MESQFIRGIVSTDVDERLNRIKIGVEDLAGEADVRQVLDRLGIPPAAVITKRAKRPPYTSTLLDRVRPLAGGYVIRWYRDAYSQIEGCTLGFNARRGTVNGFVTNSHCTETQGGWDGEEFFQHTMTASNSVGYEHSDPPFVSSFNCPQTFSCRYSDAAFVAYHTNSPTGESLFGLGQIAQTTYPPGQYSGSTTINSAHPRFYIRGEKAGPDWGEQVNKIGRTTGWTYGNVIETCSDQYRAGNKILWCQSVIDTGVGSGDSGSPVFVEDGFNQVILYGVVWGGVNGEVYFSNMSNIELDIGALDTM